MSYSEMRVVSKLKRTGSSGQYLTSNKSKLLKIALNRFVLAFLPWRSAGSLVKAVGWLVWLRVCVCVCAMGEAGLGSGGWWEV